MQHDKRSLGIAIVGIGCRFPGHANSPAQFWQLLCDGTEAIGDIPAERFDIDRVYDPDPTRPGKLHIRRAAFCDHVGLFDAAFFRISPREAAQMDPQQRILLEVAWEAMEDAGQPLTRLAGSRTGVFVGVSTHDFGDLVAGSLSRSGIGTHTATGTATSIVANRISYAFDLRGPSVAVDTACSSSLTAIHLACRSLADGECDAALVGGVNLFLTPDSAMGLAKASMLSPDCRCRAFDAHANGFVRGEGAGVVVLRRLESAARDRDRVYALIRASAINQDGRTSGITVPSAGAQEALFQEALATAGIAPHQVGYVEAHGTGTPVGDPIEAGAIGRVFSRGRHPDAPLYIGSAKTNVGHLEAAAGIVGLVKGALVLQRRAIPPNLNFAVPNPAIAFDELLLKVPVALTPWPGGDGAAIVGVNSFGFGGANAHVLLQEADAPARHAHEAGADDRRPRVLVLSASNADALRARSADIGTFLGNAAPDLDDVCHTAAVRRTHLEHRIAVLVHERAGACSALAAFARGDPCGDVVTGRAPPARRPNLALVFSGMGASPVGAGAELLRTERVFRDAIERCDAVLRPLAGWSIAAAMADPSSSATLPDAEFAQVANYALQAGLVTLLRSWGLPGDAVVGHSVGEIAAAHAAGALTLEDGVRLVFHRGRLVQRVSGKGRMLAAALSGDEARRVVERHAGLVSLAAINGAASVTLSGEPAVLDVIAADLAGRGVFHKLLDVSVPYHSAALEPLHDEFVAAVRTITGHEATLPMVSTSRGGWVSGADLDAAYWWRNLREPVRFADAIAQLAADGFEHVLQVGPHPVLRPYLRECLGPEAAILATLERNEPETASLLRAVSALHVGGHVVDWVAVAQGRGECISLPSYAWQREEFGTGAEIAAGRTSEPSGADSGHPLLGVRLPTAQPVWQARLDDTRLAYLVDHRLHGAPVYPAAAYLEAVLAVVDLQSPGTHASIGPVDFEKMLVLPQSHGGLLQVTCEREGRCDIHHGRTGGTEVAWSLHASARIATAAAPPSRPRLDVNGVLARCPDEREGGDLYRALARRGLEYTGPFHCVQRVWQGDDEALGRITAAGHEECYRIHPATLDGALQVLIAAQANGPAAAWGATFLPASVRRVVLFGRATGEVWAHATIRRLATDEIEGDVRIADDSGDVVLDLVGVRAVRVGTAVEFGRVELSLYELRWTEQSRRREADLQLPSPDALLQAIADDRHSSASRQGAAIYGDAVSRDLNGLARLFIARALGDLGYDAGRDAALGTAALAQTLGVNGRHHRFLARLIEIARSAVPAPAMGDPVEMAAQVLRAHPAWADVIDLVARSGGALRDVLRGAREAQEVLFGSDALAVLERVYAKSPVLAHSNGALGSCATQLARSLSGEARLRVLEIGAGTGGATANVLPHLPAERTDYCFTDVSPFFLARARERFAGHPGLSFSMVDIESAAPGRSLPFEAFDLVIAANVLHGTADLRATLRHVQQLLAPGGLFLMLELVAREPWADLIFGLFQGWWRFSDTDLRPSHAILDRERWLAVLAESGFEAPRALPDLEGDLHPLHAVIVAGRGDVDNVTASVAAAPDATWLIVGPGRGTAARLAAALERRGARCVVVDGWQVDAPIPEGVTGAAWLAGIDLPALDGLSASAPLEHTSSNLSALGTLVRALAAAQRGPSHLWLVSAGAQRIDTDQRSIEVMQAPMWAVGRVVMEESPALGCRLADLGPDASDDEIDALADEMSSDTRAEELVFRGRRRFVSNLDRAAVGSLQSPPGDAERLVHVGDAHGAGGQVRLEIDSPGDLDSLALRAVRATPPAADEVLVRTHAAGLNFKDVVHALGLLPFLRDDPRVDTSCPLGFECAGVVVAAGSAVRNMRPGDEVCGIGSGTIATHVRVPAQLAFSRPQGLAAEDAAGVLLPFATSLYALVHLARIQPGERVLVHSAAGGVGLAALQICRDAGADVLATAGSDEKRRFLRAAGIEHVMDSRSPEFADRVLEATCGEGVDVVLNSLAGDAIEKGLSVLRPFGRFVEIGKRDLLQNTSLGLRPFERQLSFFSVDLDRLRRQRPNTFAALCREVLDGFVAGRWQPLPRTDFELSDARSAFRWMAQGRHIGKIVLLTRRDEYVARPTRAQFLCLPNASYLITGGLGGFGLATAQWLVTQGARHIVLMGRHREPLPPNRAALQRLMASGARVEIVAGDVADERDVARLLAQVQDTMPPLRGVFHEAAALDDRWIGDLTPARWRDVLAPKLSGAWHLHRLTRDLDWFVLFSSATAILGNVGQANYGAANAFLDALAQHRRAQGLHALSIGWGLLGDVGIVLDRTDLQRYFDRIGFEALSSAEAFEILGPALRSDAAYVSPFRMDWRKLASHRQRAGSRFTKLLAEAARGSAPAAARTAPPELGAAGAQTPNTKDAVSASVLRCVATILGSPVERIDTAVALTGLGLDSLMAVELESAIKRDLGLHVPAVRILQGMDVRQLVDAVLERRVVGAVAATPLALPASADRLPLAPGQRRLWFLQQLDPESVAYNMPLAIRMSGALNAAALEQAVNEVVRRQEALRATFGVEDSEPVQRIAAAYEVTMPLTDLAADTDRDATLERLARDEARRPFDLAQGPLFRTRLVRMSEREHVLLATAHHLVVDAWSAGIITGETAACYGAILAGRRPDSAPRPLSYAESVRRQLEAVAERRLEELAYWREQLRGVPPLRLRPLHSGWRRTGESLRLSFELRQDLLAAVEALARRESTTPFTVLLTAFEVLLARQCTQEDFCIGTPVASRFDDDSRDLVGCFVNTLAVRAHVAPMQTFRDLLRRTRDTMLAAVAHQQVPWEQVVEHLNPPREPGRLPVFQTLFVLHDFALAPLAMPGVEIEWNLTPVDTSPFDLTLVIDSRKRHATFEYDRAFDARTVRTMVDHFLLVLEDAVAQPALPVDAQPRSNANGQLPAGDGVDDVDASAHPACGLHELFERQAERTPDALAVVGHGERFSYRQLDEACEALAAVLQGHGVGVGSVVAIALDRSPRALVAMFAILKAGAAFVPVDWHMPEARVAAMLDDAHITVIVGDRSVAVPRACGRPIVVIDAGGADTLRCASAPRSRPEVRPDDLAYVIYTSGSTGRPNGVLVEHRNIVNQVAWRQAAFPLKPGDAVLHASALGFDPALWEVFGPLSAGAAVVVVEGAAHDGRAVNLMMREQRVTTVQGVPSLLRSWLDQRVFDGCRTLERVFSGGEPLDALLQARLLSDTRVELVNLYGCTETAIDACWHHCDAGMADGVAPIGRAIAGTRLYVVDDRLQPVTDGLPGELVVAGRGVARGYVNDAELTARRFIQDPFAPGSGRRAFRTGDIVRRLPDGELEFLGRADRQLKVRGVRVEATEVEAALRCHPALRDCAVDVRTDTSGDAALVAWIVMADGTAPIPSDLRAFLQRWLPDAMLPGRYLPVSDLPRLPSGKVDQRALRDTELPAPTHVGARTLDEGTLVRLWREMLKAPAVGVTDDFFDLGGHSLLAVRVAARMSSLLGREIRCQDVIRHRTIEGIVAAAARADELGGTRR